MLAQRAATVLLRNRTHGRATIGFDMALSNAERQARYRRRLKTLAASGDTAIQKLNEAYTAAAVTQRESALRAISMEMGQSADRNFVRAMERMMSGLPPAAYAWTLDDWCDIARQIGQKDEEASIFEAREEALRRTAERPSRPWAPFSKVDQGQ